MYVCFNCLILYMNNANAIPFNFIIIQEFVFESQPSPESVDVNALSKKDQIKMKLWKK